MKRVEEDGVWSLMCPNECPRLADVWGEEFEALYTFYEQKKMYRRQVPAKKLWQMILDAQIQTGTPYLCYKDAANRKSNQQNIGTIKSSNLCTEIMEYTSEDETAVCNLGSLALPRFVKNGVFDFEALRTYTAILTRNLNKVIDLNYYPTEKCRRSNLRHRPIGIGVQGLADVFAMLRLSWTSDAAAKLNREIFENLYFAAVTASVEESVLANTLEQWRGIEIEVGQRGSYVTFPGSPASKGKLQFDLWEQQPTQSSYLDWEGLKGSVKKYGLRNSLLVAPMPTASTSQILGNNECIEPFTSNMYTRRVLSGEFVVINKYLVDDLVRMNLWTPEIRSQIIANNGSIQSIIELPSELRMLYRTAWEIPQKTLISLAADRAPFICQSQSLNLFVAEPTYSKLSSMHLYAWKAGLKTGCYYLRTKGAAKAQQFTVEPPACVTCSA
jgi:ribonucleoside-diphosphate reductase alpha chain